MTFEGKEETQLPLVDRTKCFVFDTPINLSKGIVNNKYIHTL